MTNKEILIEARALLATGKWCKGQSVSRNGSYCAVAALGAVINKIYKSQSYDYTCYTILYAPISTKWHSITCWNDRPERTLQDVLDLYDKAIASI